MKKFLMIMRANKRLLGIKKLKISPIPKVVWEHLGLTPKHFSSAVNFIYGNSTEVIPWDNSNSTPAISLNKPVKLWAKENLQIGDIYFVECVAGNKIVSVKLILSKDIGFKGGLTLEGVPDYRFELNQIDLKKSFLGLLTI